ncbi:glycosyltransferase family 2 protein [Epibacterium sp. SM1979]|uniref:Glycosyltransferase family 2 protein n=1 Tax=Tritonibacter litoralis TaxID=2662264 RepID=A0A843YGG1_9RHOB|nr:glycosyltransferase family A protein [Tritonibacter litoralis]MQQ09941.1 glycosyltransferase family 2 protein [Tritonibacter litoralis]
MRVSSNNLPDTAASDRPLVTVFCAVWHKQPNKLELLRTHWENLKQQTLPVEPCYIFDNGDTPPDWLDAPWHSFSEPLTIYQAWAAGVAFAQTRYVMNLNMDDRLATDAAELMLRDLREQNAALVAGEWLVCFDHAFQSQSFASSHVAETVFISGWPPKPAENLRLGSGTGERIGTFGPATMWDLEKTKRWYPTYFGNEAPILSRGDSIFWQYLIRSNMKLTRLPQVIGRYYSSPDAQGEFRPHNDDENLKQFGVHKVSFVHQIGVPRLDKTAAPATPAAPRNAIEAQSQQLAARYSAMLRGAQSAAPGS